MERESVGIVAAMPEEVAPLVRRFSARRLNDRKTYAGTCGRLDIIIVQSGMGSRRALQGVSKLLDITRPKLIVSCGVGGAVIPGLAAGDVVLGKSVFRLSGGGLAPSPCPPFVPEESGTLVKGTFITTEGIEPKERLAALLGTSTLHPVVDMETAAVVEAGAAAGIPVLAIRGISDDAAEELKFSLEEFTDKDLNLQISRVAVTVLRKPWIIPQLIRLAGNTKRAAENVAESLHAILEKEIFGN